jgi:uncharacterized protein YacL (UPF0231 family)
MKHYSYKGFEYRTWDEVEEDNIKIFHECWKDGKQIKMPSEFYNASPYSLIKLDDFIEFINTVEVFIQS